VGAVGDRFGFSLVAGDFNCDGYEDLAIGVPNDTVSSEPLSGRVVIVPAKSDGTGLDATQATEWHQDATSIIGVAETSDGFGYSLAAGNFDNSSNGGNPCMDLAVGVPFESSTKTDQGAVNVIYGTSVGLSATNNQLFSLGDAGLPAAGDVESEFGRSLAVGRYNNDAYDELVVGNPGEESKAGDTNDPGKTAGFVAVLPGSASRLTTTGHAYWSQGTNGDAVPGNEEQGDMFGFAVGGGTNRQLVIGVPGEDLNGPIYETGYMNVITTGTGSSLSIQAGSSYTHGNFGDTSGEKDNFGLTLTRARP
jgi:hypothetical protein